uniref:PDZ domain-containing protein n=1 Tax=Fundulus heteroclitus TaxID=8078 RepID=A0A3Q2Q2V8_FUNHE
AEGNWNYLINNEGELLSVELEKDRQGLGLSLAGNRDRSRLSIFVVRGGAAELDGRLMQGDQILAVNSEDTRHASQEAVAAMLKRQRGTVTLDRHPPAHSGGPKGVHRAHGIVPPGSSWGLLPLQHAQRPPGVGEKLCIPAFGELPVQVFNLEAGYSVSRCDFKASLRVFFKQTKRLLERVFCFPSFHGRAKQTAEVYVPLHFKMSPIRW